MSSVVISSWKVIIRLGTKSDLLGCLDSCTDNEVGSARPDTDVTILDGAVLVNILKPLAAKTFDEYALKVFLPYIQSALQRASRVEKRGKGVRRRVDASTNIPGNWQQFLRVDANKTELFSFLAKHVVNLSTDKKLVTTDGSAVLCNTSRDTSHLAPCDHEEADTRMMLHLADSVVLAVAAPSELEMQELWVAFETGQHFRYIAAHQIAASLGTEESQALPLFHAYTGCDTVSSFSTRGKKTAWDTWKAFGELTAAVLTLSRGPADITDDVVSVFERFTILLYDRTSNIVNIDEARQALFAKKGRAMDAIPPTKAALIQHIKRAVYQGGHCWGNMFKVAIEMPSPEDWGWVDPHNWRPIWTNLPEANASSRELLCCGCKKGCRGRCTCKKAALKCTALCQCDSHCDT